MGGGGGGGGGAPVGSPVSFLLPFPEKRPPLPCILYSPEKSPELYNSFIFKHYINWSAPEIYLGFLMYITRPDPPLPPVVSSQSLILIINVEGRGKHRLKKKGIHLLRLNESRSL